MILNNNLSVREDERKIKVLVKLFQKLVGAGDIAGRLRGGEMLLSRFFLPSFFFALAVSKKKRTNN